MDKAFYEVLIDGEKLIDEDFTMGIFYGIRKKLPPLQEYLDIMFDKKTRQISGALQRRGQCFAMVFIAIWIVLSDLQRYCWY